MKQTLTAGNLTDYINQSLCDTLALMQRFEETGMDVDMKDDYLALYDIYTRLQEQKAGIESTRAAASGLSPLKCE